MDCQAVFNAMLSCFILSGVNGAINLVPNNTAAAVGDDVRLTCECASTPSSGIDWQFGLSIIAPGCVASAPYQTDDTTGDSCILIIPSVSLSQAGRYSCVYAGYDGTSYGADVIVAEHPPAISEESGKNLTTLYINEDATINCSFPNFVEVNSFTANIILSSDNPTILSQEKSSPCSSSSCEVLANATASSTALSAELYCTVNYIATQGSDAWLTTTSDIIFNLIPSVPLNPVAISILTPTAKVYKVGDVLTCYYNESIGPPIDYMEWTDFKNHTTRVYNTVEARINFTQAGNHLDYTCTVGNQDERESKTEYFYVVEGDSRSSKVGPIVGGVLGGIALLFIVVVLVVYCIKKHKSKNADGTSSHSSVSPAPINNEGNPKFGISATIAE